MPSIIDLLVVVCVSDFLERGAVPFANVCDMIALVFEQSRVSVFPSCVPLAILRSGGFVSAVVHSRVQSGSTDPADAGGDSVVGESDSFFCQFREKWAVDVVGSFVLQRIMPPV